MASKKLLLSIGIMAYNEDKNISHLLDSIKKQILKSVKISEIIIVSSGSIDKTNSLIRSHIKSNRLIKLIIQRKRQGKSAAVNLFLKQSKENLLMLLSADLILEKNTIEKITSHFKKPSIGIVGAHPIPVNSKNNFMGFAGHFLWELHHQVSLKNPKMGEMVVFRKIFKQIPSLSAVDEANIEPLIKGQGYKAIYEPKAIVYNKSPENINEFLSVRRRIYAGHLSAKYEYSYEVSTLNSISLLSLIIKNFKLSLPELFWIPAVVLLEAYARLLGFLDYRYKRQNHTIWATAPSAKTLISK